MAIAILDGVKDALVKGHACLAVLFGEENGREHKTSRRLTRPIEAMGEDEPFGDAHLAENAMLGIFNALGRAAADAPMTTGRQVDLAGECVVVAWPPPA